MLRWCGSLRVPQDMVQRRVTLATVWSPGVLLRLLDVAASRRAEHRRRVQEAQLAQRLQAQAGGSLEAGQLRQLVAAAKVGEQHGAGGAGGCDHRHHHH